MSRRAPTQPHRKSRSTVGRAAAWRSKIEELTLEQTAAAATPPQEELTASDEEVFRRAIEALDEIPDKDQSVAPLSSAKVAEKKTPKKLQRRPDASLDLHGQTVNEARAALLAFMTQSRMAGHRMVHVVTGKGYRSAGGTGVLKRELERWIRHEGLLFVAAFSEAPRALGGSGAYLLYLR